MAGALAGTTVLEIASYVAGPYAGVLLADMGATVIKVEAPPDGDPYRGWGEERYSPTFCSVNRNKQSLLLDLRRPDGRDAFLRLAARADVVIENLRPGVVDRLGVGYEAVRARNPRIVYCSLSGFGQDGPYRDRPGYDTLGQAMSGLLSLLTDRAAPRPMGISLSDHLTGIFACYGILCALLARERTGKGQRVETSLLRATVAFIGENAARYLAGGEVPDRASRTRLAQVFAFTGGDGLPFVVHLSSPPKFWEGLTAALERPDLRADPRFASRPARQRHYDELRALLAEVFATAPRAVWLERLLAHDVPCGPLNTLAEAFEDPQVRHLGMVTETRHPQLGSVRLTANPVTLSATPPQLAAPPPALGEHTEAVLRAAGYSAAALAELRAAGAIP
jgi:crotonobetainyl-CoA:carnitine CoA-transferase CaiB-like acyl-CoA transferase